MQSSSITGADILSALEQQEFVLHYQPQVDLFRQRIAGAEALIRWQHPEHGLLAPGHFIEAAETTGAIIALGRWVMETAARQAAHWRSQGRPLTVAVNVSPRQVRPALVDEVMAAMETAALPAAALEVEITENLLMSEDSIEIVEALMQAGVPLAIDDFGVGYSSLALLSRLHAHKLKIDRSFLARVPGNLDDCLLLSAMIELGHGLGMTVLAEGVETREQVEFLRAFGADQVQGYYLGKPVPAAEIDLLLEAAADLNLETARPFGWRTAPLKDPSPLPGTAHRRIQAA